MAALPHAPTDGGTPWEILDLPPPSPRGSDKVVLADVRRAFRKAAKTAHPDVEGGSKEAFEILMWAYHEVITRGAEAGSVKPSGQAPPKDDFLHDFVHGYGNLANVEAETDDDGWLGREPLGDFFVRRHDAVTEGFVQEGNIAIYRLLQSINGRFWGVGKVVAMQATYSRRNTPPGGRIFLIPLKMKESGPLDEDKAIHLVPDECAEIAPTRVIDRFELLQGPDVRVVDEERSEYTVLRTSSAHARLMSARVHIAQCEFEEECEVKAEECIYCYGEECEVEF